MNRPNTTKPQQFEKTTTSDWQAAGVDIRFWKALARGGGGKLGIILTCPIACQLAIYCAIIKNVKIQKYIF